VDSTHDLTELSDEELKEKIQELTAQERQLSYERRLLHGRIELLKSELVMRLKGRSDGELAKVDVESLTAILAQRLPDLERLEGAEPVE
jgi:Glu-tRNA(Gln) amidotransferase subunit E-like FAD-binding protein